MKHNLELHNAVMNGDLAKVQRLLIVHPELLSLVGPGAIGTPFHCVAYSAFHENGLKILESLIDAALKFSKHETLLNTQDECGITALIAVLANIYAINDNYTNDVYTKYADLMIHYGATVDENMSKHAIKICNTIPYHLQLHFYNKLIETEDAKWDQIFYQFAELHGNDAKEKHKLKWL